ncbi:MAG TPA: ATP-grasp domain-containing protein [Pirellulales bacterium]|jgi:predicted ATP-grasp superfamily ATP-dependent carboligase|nr:ATP-grasp domain-containing protein [Pirellulales bacterium]
MGPAIGVSNFCNEQADETILIVGASARAAAMSARRGGLNPWAADLFADLDLRSCCPVERIDAYPEGLEQALAAAPPGPWMYTGALENHPALVDRMAAFRPLIGVGGEALRAVRDPRRVAAAVRAAGFSAPRCSLHVDGVPTDGSWLSKPLASAGGSRIEPWLGGPANSLSAPHRYFQEFIEGLPASAVYIGTGNEAICLGLTRQLIGMPWCGTGMSSSDRFRYCGSIGPLAVSPDASDRIHELGIVLARAFDLVGLFSVDLISNGDQIWPIEVNPRYTASVEVLERAYGINAVSLHVAACRRSSDDEKTLSANVASSAFECRNRVATGKAVLYSTASWLVGADFSEWAERQNQGHDWPILADIPATGTAIRPGHPIITVLVGGCDEPSVVSSLQQLAAAAYEKVAVGEADANNCPVPLS